MKCQELSRRVAIARMPPMRMSLEEVDKPRKLLKPVAIYLGDEQYRQLLNDRESRDLTNIATRRHGEEPLTFMGIPTYCVRATNHCFVATTESDE